MTNHRRLAAKHQPAEPNRSLIGIMLFVICAVLSSALPANASCMNFAGQNEHLSNYCLLEAVRGRLLDEQTALAITERLQQATQINCGRPSIATHRSGERQFYLAIRHTL